MLWTVAAILAMLWALAMLTEATLGGFIHLLLLLSAAAVIMRLLPRSTT